MFLIRSLFLIRSRFVLRSWFVADSFQIHDSFLIRSKLPIRIDPKMPSISQKDSWQGISDSVVFLLWFVCSLFLTPFFACRIVAAYITAPNHFWLLVGFLTLGRYSDYWSIYYLLVNSLTLGQFIIFWSIPWLLVNYLTLVHFIKPWSVFRLLVNRPRFKPDSFNRFSYSIDQKSQALESIRPYRPRPVENMSHVDSSRFGIQKCPVNLSDRFFCSKPILQDRILGLVY